VPRPPDGPGLGPVRPHSDEGVALTAKPADRRKAAARTRTTLSSERILTAAMQLALHSTEALSLSRLGAALDADPTAVYRHFRSRDALLRAMADAVHEQVDAELEQIPTDASWREAMERHSWTIRRCFLRYPALAREYCHRVTGGVHEARGVRRFADILIREGLAPPDAVLITRAVAELVFGALSSAAGVATMSPAHQRAEIRRAHSPHPLGKAGAAVPSAPRRWCGSGNEASCC